MFHDITTLLLDHAAFKDTIDLFVERYKDMNISVVAGKFVYSFCIYMFRRLCVNVYCNVIEVVEGKANHLEN